MKDDLLRCDQEIPRNTAVPEMVVNESAVAHITRALERGHYTRVSGSGDTLGLTDGRMYMWFKAPQKTGSIIRREYRIPDLNTFAAVHFKILSAIPRARVAAIQREFSQRGIHLITRKQGYWYEVHGD